MFWGQILIFNKLYFYIIYNLGNFLFGYDYLKKHWGLNFQTTYEKLKKVAELLK